ncbi:uncharacterized protein isoform X1 [Takifugu rubripes]|uniref:uncharacterized protein isoform X1 n=1 Tax=Takifugu rubripes TaxID=31033 RepID=UPI001145BC4F|nr:uncharacterized protein LOC105418978 isoform X1 [Takifugu rubripes]
MLHHMIGGLAALILLSRLSQNEDVPHKIPVRVVNQGDNVTLTCPGSSDVTGFFLHKLKFGYLAQIFASGYGKVSLRGQFNTPRFTATTENSLHLFKIRNASKEDEATYLCQAGTAYEMSFTNGTVLIVNADARVQFVVVIGILSVCCVLLLAALIICSKRKPAVLTTGDPHSSAEDHLEDGKLREESYVTLNFPSRKKRHAAKECIYSECIYFGVRG